MTLGETERKKMTLERDGEKEDLRRDGENER